MSVCMGFPPVFDNNSKVLILGSFPSVKSRAAQFYYGHPQNRFWKVLKVIYNEEPGKSIAEKKAFLLKHGIALWDIVAECEIEGSADTSIKNAGIADLDTIMTAAAVKKILCNGRKAYELTLKQYGERYKNIYYLPSTSPANAVFDINAWIKELTE